jgi:hypothetical protein
MGGTNRRTGTAVNALVFVPGDFLGRVFDDHPLLFKVLDGVFEIFFRTRQLQHHNPLFSGQNGSLEYIESKVIIFGQMTDYGFFHLPAGKMKDQNF